jgi:hypothetical protein
MSTQRIRRRGPDGKDLILDVDLGPATVAARAGTGGSLVGHMQPIIIGGSHLLRRSRGGGRWAASRAFTINSKKQRPGQPWHEPRQNNP